MGVSQFSRWIARIVCHLLGVLRVHYLAHGLLGLQCVDVLAEDPLERRNLRDRDPQIPVSPLNSYVTDQTSRRKDPPIA